MALLNFDIAWAINVANTWPTSLPDKPLQDGYTESPPNNIIKTSVDKGPAKLRKRTSTNTRPITCRIVVSRYLVNVFDYFYITECASGTLRFSWEHPRTGITYDFRFDPNAMPQYSSVGGDDFSIEFKLEQMP
jgi:hypothetical protein